MTQSTPTIQDQPLPLKKLTRIRYNDGHVRIKAELLRRLDLSRLDHCIQFDLVHRLAAKVDLHRCPCENHLELKLTVATRLTEWPQPNERWADVYCGALSIAAWSVFDDGKMGGAYRTSVYQKSHSVVIQTVFPLTTSGDSLLAILKHQLGRTRRELSNVLKTIARGPKPGSSRLNHEW